MFIILLFRIENKLLKEGKISVEDLEKVKKDYFVIMKELIQNNKSEKKTLYLVQEESVIDELVTWIACQSVGLVPAILPPDVKKESIKLDAITVPKEACMAVMTSGTTGTPKGVQLTYKNFLAQLDEIPERIFLAPGDRALSVLPVWHVFEREVEYVILIQGGALCYSKPVGSIMLADFQAINPHLLPAVPRVFEAVYDGVTKKMRKTGGIVLAMFNFFVKVAV